jgi:hypothetical protein
LEASGMIGTITPKDKYLLRKHVGNAKNKSGQEYEMILNVGMNPGITSEQTGKTWLIGWEELLILR